MQDVVLPHHTLQPLAKQFVNIVKRIAHASLVKKQDIAHDTNALVAIEYSQ